MKRHLGWLGVIAQLVLTTHLFFLSKATSSAWMLQPLRSLGHITGLLGIVLVSNAIILSVKSRSIESLFGGLDKAYRAHQSLGGVGIIVVFLHPVFFIVHALPDRSVALSYIIPNAQMLSSAAGIAALWVFAVLIIVTLYVRLPYHIWRSLHQWMGGGVLLSGIHAGLVSGDVSRFVPLRVWILGITGVAIACWVYMLLVYPRRKLRNPFTIDAICRIGDVFDVRLTPVRRMVRYVPGQFAFITIPRILEDGHGHPFSIVSHPSDEHLRFGIKISGDHTLNLRDAKRGDRVFVSGPYGRFTEPYFVHQDRPLICIAGGIGITPFVGLVKEHAVRHSGRRFTLLYSVRSTTEALYHDEIQALALCTKDICYRLHVTTYDGRLTADQVMHAAPYAKDASIFLCGPERMMLDLRNQLMRCGVRQSRIFFENFAFV